MEEMNDLEAIKCSLRRLEKRVEFLTLLKEEEIRQRELAQRQLHETRVELNVSGKEVEALKAQLKVSLDEVHNLRAQLESSRKEKEVDRRISNIGKVSGLNMDDGKHDLSGLFSLSTGCSC